MRSSATVGCDRIRVVGARHAADSKSGATFRAVSAAINPAVASIPWLGLCRQRQDDTGVFDDTAHGGQRGGDRRVTTLLEVRTVDSDTFAFIARWPGPL